MLAINIKKENTNSLQIEIVGEIDASSSIELDNALTEALNSGTKNILINCSELHYISSAGLGVFMSYIEETKEKNIQMVLFGMSEKIYNIFKLLGLHNLLNIVSDEMEAKSVTNAN